MSDEHYLVDLCDRVLERKALRGHRFDFLRGDPARSGRRRQLPVDAWYPDLSLVVEIMEVQHYEAVPLFDRRPTVSGVPRGEQRRIYDARRAEVLPRHGIRLVVLDVRSFPTRARKLARNAVADEAVVLARLAEFLEGGSEASPRPRGAARPAGMTSRAPPGGRRRGRRTRRPRL